MIVLSACRPTLVGVSSSTSGSGGAPRRPRGAHRKGPGRGSRWAVRAARAVAAVLSVSILLGSGYAWASYRSFSSGVTQLASAIPAPDPATPSPVDTSEQNILLVGDDHRPADASPELLALLSTQQDGGSVNTDTMMVLHLPAGGGAPTVVSFPRDSWVEIPGHGMGKLNSAFELGSADGAGDAGGMRLLIETVQGMTGLTIEHFVRISLVGFYDIANALGPIQVCLNQAAVDPYSGTDLPAGVSTLDAKQALSFVRQRHGLPRGDLDRQVRQQYFLAAELEKLTSAGVLLNPLRQQQLLGAVSSALQTDPGLDLLGLAGRFQGLTADQVRYATIPVTGTPTIRDAAGRDVSIVAVDTAAMPGFIASVVAGTPAPAPAAPTTAAPGTPTPAPAPAPATDEPGQSFGAGSCIN